MPRYNLHTSLLSHGIAFKIVPVGATEAVLVVRVAQSWLAPHRIGKPGNREFWARSSAGKYPMTIWQLRDAFVLSGSVHERIRSFVSERVEECAGYRLAIQFPNDQPKAVLHLVPLSAFARPEQRIDVVNCL